MDLYVRVLKYIKPHWRPVSIGIFFTLTFVFFNSISVWVSADFVRTLFDAEQKRAESEITKNEGNQESHESREEWLTGQIEHVRFYDKLKSRVESVLIRDDQAETLRIVCIVIFLSFLLKNLSSYLHRVFFFFAQLKIVIQLRN